jgi:hypothetical protein
MRMGMQGYAHASKSYWIRTSRGQSECGVQGCRGEGGSVSKRVAELGIGKCGRKSKSEERAALPTP